MAAAIGRLSESSEGSRIGPRTVRCFIFRYQLGRLLLEKTDSAERVGQLADALCDVDVGRPPREAADPVVVAIAEQVSRGVAPPA